MAIKWDKQSEKLVHGYIHEIETDIFVIPDTIITICLLYFFQLIDEWDFKTASEYALIDGRFLSNKEEDKRFSTFGVLQFNKGIHVWNFKIHKLSQPNEHCLYFGIATDTKYKDGWYGDNTNDEATNYYNYAFGVSAWITDKGVLCNPTYRSANAVIGFNWKSGDELCMKLDLSEKTLIYTINKTEVAVIDNVYNDFEDKPDVKYRMANNMLSIVGTAKVELMSYECLSLC